ncbi:MAG: DNA-(apurinic or apyrimidinic site) lyase / Formamidopyrimidine-DNA glycosylase [Cyanobacteria bacterium RYN_339]|nr:DNA-(apurinic or apyrimidinic site) lyase / Formamidopyrimidine-DNA glycosylase [Cyanobacteria bacterium RYN_339]
MPELPEVETVARDLAAQANGRTITGVEWLDWPRMIETPDEAGFRAGIAGRKILAVARRAKWVLATLEGGLTLAVHLRMSGSLVVYPADHPIDPYTHLVLALDDGRRIFFRDVRKFGRVRLLDAAGLAALDAHHGVEPLSDGFTPAVFARILAGKSTRIKPLLLDQALIAGLGNIYVDEALWHAKIHPERPAAAVQAKEAKALHGAIQEVLTKSITLGGSSFRDYRNGYGQQGGNQVSFAVYQRGGEPCQRCGGLIERMVVAQRGTHVCPKCQPR